MKIPFHIPKSASLILLSLLPLTLLAEWPKHIIQPPVKSGIPSAFAADFDKDGHIDVISSHSNAVLLYKGPDWKRSTLHSFDPKNFSRKPRPACIHSCLLDVDNDGDPDFIGSNQNIFWLECPDDPFSNEPWTFRIIDNQMAGIHCVITGDVDRDGRTDLIANSFADPSKTKIPHSIAWLSVPKNPKTSKSWQRHVFADRDAPGGNHYMGFGDVNGDGRPDISCGAKGGDGFPNGEWFAWWEQPANPKKAWTKHMLSAQQPGASNIMQADLNADGHTDFFATRGHGIGALWFKGPDFIAHEVDSTINAPHSLDLADIDNDGDIDAVTCGKFPDGIAAWYENDGKGNFTRHIIARNQGSYDTRAIDMDNDGDLDILIGGQTSKNIVWYENQI